MILEILSQLTLDIMNKGLGITKVFLKEDFEYWLYDWNDNLVATLMFSPLKPKNAMEK